MQRIANPSMPVRFRLRPPFFHMIQVLTLSDFRNHESSRVKTGDAKAIVITGPNGSGKTSILEAISMFSGTGTMRGATPSEIARIGGQGGFGVVAELSDGTNLSVSWSAGDAHRRARVDGDSAPLSVLSAHLRMIWVTPREDRLFTDPASDRRAFFDRLVAAFDPAHAGRVARLSKLLSERAFALKSGGGADWLEPIESQIAGTAVSVAAARIKYVGEINYFLSGYRVSISGMLEEGLSRVALASSVEKEYAEYLASERVLVADKMTANGAHRSDFGMISQDLNMPVGQTSTGQQKSALLALILAHAKLVKAKTGARPLILLDEAAAHLDSSARAAFFVELADADAQVWATGIEPELFTGVAGAVFIGCKSGQIVCNMDMI